MTKLKLALIFLLALSSFTAAQTPGGSTLDLGQSLENYKRASIDQNVDQVMSFTYQGLFKIMPKEQVRAGIMEMYKRGAAPKIKQMQFMPAGALQPYSKGQFVIISYHVELEMPRPGDATPEIDQFVIKMLKQLLGDDVAVAIDEKNGLIKVARDTQMIALNEGNQGWKMIEKDNLLWLIDGKALPEDLAQMLQASLFPQGRPMRRGSGQ